MSGQYRMMFASRLLMAALPFALIGASASAGSNSIDPSTDPMRFFEGRTESLSTIKLIMKKPYRSRTIGEGEINDGVLNLVQRVHQDGEPPYSRRWRMRQVAPGRFAGTMSEAIGPVQVDQVGERYRFRFKLKGNVAIEQWLIPLPGGTMARTKLSVRKFGLSVGRSEGTIRKL
jgi:hypothetical protein